MPPGTQNYEYLVARDSHSRDGKPQLPGTEQRGTPRGILTIPTLMVPKTRDILSLLGFILLIWKNIN